jgi:hypothetical protein
VFNAISVWVNIERNTGKNPKRKVKLKEFGSVPCIQQRFLNFDVPPVDDHVQMQILKKNLHAH